MQTKEQTIILLANPGTAPSNANYHGSISMLQPREMISKDEFSIVSAQPWLMCFLQFCVALFSSLFKYLVTKKINGVLPLTN